MILNGNQNSDIKISRITSLWIIAHIDKSRSMSAEFDYQAFKNEELCNEMPIIKLTQYEWVLFDVKWSAVRNRLY